MLVPWAEVGTTAAPFSGTWTQFNVGAVYRAQYGKDAAGFVVLRGLIQNTVNFPAGTMFTLPVGFRPHHDEYFNACLTDNAQSIFAMMDVNPSGAVALSFGATPWGASGFLSLNGVRFSPNA